MCSACVHCELSCFSALGNCYLAPPHVQIATNSQVHCMSQNAVFANSTGELYVNVLNDNRAD